MAPLFTDNQLVVDGNGAEQFFFVLAKDSIIDQSASNIFKYLFIDDDPVINITQPCVVQSSQATNETDGCTALGRPYPPKRIDITGTSRDDWFGSSIQLGIDDVLINSSHAVVVFYQKSPSESWSTVTSATQRKSARICTMSFSNSPINASVSLQFANWMNGMQFSAVNNITMYNLTTGAAVAYPSPLNTSIYDGCFLTEIIPGRGSWVSGRNDIMGTAIQVGATGSEDVWIGPVEYWVGGAGYLG
jgi:hypothetical protein